MRPVRRWGIRGAAMLVAPSVVAMLLLAGCGAAPPRIGTDGIDLLEIPTPAPDPRDFVEGVDHPLLPLTPGSRWEYAVEGGGKVVRRVVEVLEDARAVAGVPTVAVRDVDLGADALPRAETVRRYAQDAAGNLWLLAVERTLPEPTSWEAGPAAGAGLVLAASPRVGDGYVEVDAPGVDEGRVTVLGVAGEVELGDRRYDRVVDLERIRTEPPTTSVVTSYAPGVGVVVERSRTGRVDELRSHRRAG